MFRKPVQSAAKLCEPKFTLGRGSRTREHVPPCHAEIQPLEPRRFFSVVYQLQDLGSLSGYADLTATSINARGDVVGFAGTSDPYYEIGDARAFGYIGGKLSPLAGRGSIATGINDSGKVVGSKLVGGDMHVYLANTATGTTSDITTAVVGPNNNGEQLLTIPHAISNTGQVAGEIIYAYTGDQLAWVYNPAASGDKVRAVAGDSNSAALAINDSGVSAGYSGSIMSAQAFSNTGGSNSHNLGLLPQAQAWSASRALGINNAGMIVGDSSADENGSISHAVMYINGSVRDLGTLAGMSNSTADDINNQGVTVGGSDGHAFVFRYGKMVDLNVIVPKINGLVLTEAVGINDNGQIAVNGTIHGHTHAFLLTPSYHATISGTVFTDTNRDGIRQASETPLKSRQIYVDSNHNGRYDPGEQTTFTDAAGRYTLKLHMQGPMRIAQVTPKGWTAVARRTTDTRVTTAGDVSVSPFASIGNINFGSRKV